MWFPPAYKYDSLTKGCHLAIRAPSLKVMALGAGVFTMAYISYFNTSAPTFPISLFLRVSTYFFCIKIPEKNERKTNEKIWCFPSAAAVWKEADVSTSILNDAKKTTVLSHGSLFKRRMCVCVCVCVFVISFSLTLSVCAFEAVLYCSTFLFMTYFCMCWQGRVSVKRDK